MMPYPTAKSLRLMFAFLAMLVLSACSVGREYQAPETEQLVQGQFMEQEQGRFRSAEPIADWWRHFNEDQLSHLQAILCPTQFDIRTSYFCSNHDIDAMQIGFAYGQVRF